MGISGVQVGSVLDHCNCNVAREVFAYTLCTVLRADVAKPSTLSMKASPLPFLRLSPDAPLPAPEPPQWLHQTGRMPPQSPRYVAEVHPPPDTSLLKASLGEPPQHEPHLVTMCDYPMKRLQRGSEEVGRAYPPPNVGVSGFYFPGGQGSY
jgi:hypothetical protein